MTVPDNAAGFDRLRAFIEDAEDFLTPVETHGLLCALAIHPAPPSDWQHQLTPEPGRMSAELTRLLEHERARLDARLGTGDGVQLPCRLDPWEDNDGWDLASWCAGFMAGVMATGEDWPDADPEQADRLLPFVLIAGLDDDPELDELWQQEQLVRQMASSIPVVLDELYLQMRGAGEPESAG